jgi:hypothetical protein
MTTETASPAPNSTQAAPPSPVSLLPEASASVALSRPERLPEKFWDSEKGAVRTDDLAKAYTELERRMSGLVPGPGSQDWDTTLRRALEIPETPDGYKIEMKDDFLTVDPGVNARLHQAGFSPRQAQLVYDLAVERIVPLAAQLAGEARRDQTIDRLTEEFGGAEKWNALAGQIAAWGKQNLAPAVFEALSATPDGIRAMRRLMESGEPSLGAPGGSPAPASEAELREMMKDKRYWRERDPAFIRAVTEGYRRLYDGKA